jgi:hypothetical protein
MVDKRTKKRSAFLDIDEQIVLGMDRVQVRPSLDMRNAKGRK